MAQGQISSMKSHPAKRVEETFHDVRDGNAQEAAEEHSTGVVAGQGKMVLGKMGN